MNDLLLGGLSADNPLGYLAALGVLRTATLASRENRFEMGWEIVKGNWQPRLFSLVKIDRATLIDLLDKQLKDNANLAAFGLGKDLTINIGDFRKALIRSQTFASPEDRRNIDFLAAFGSDAIQSQSNGKPTGQIADTDFRTMSGAGHQHFIETIRTFIADTHIDHLDKAIFETWTYNDPLKSHSMRWDPVDDNRYALRWGDPAKDPTKSKSGSVWGGNRLAIEALPLFPTQPSQRELKTTGFFKRNRTTTLSWPVWSPPISLLEVRSLLAHSQLQQEQPDRIKLSALGVVEVFRSQRITQGKYRNFVTPRPM